MSDKGEGVYNKYKVERIDGGSEPGCKHHKCNYFVLDLVHDPFALPALVAYAKACNETYPVLATDLFRVVQQLMDSDLPTDAVA
jgi:hypothetical protein